MQVLLVGQYEVYVLCSMWYDLVTDTGMFTEEAHKSTAEST